MKNETHLTKETQMFIVIFAEKYVGDHIIAESKIFSTRELAVAYIETLEELENGDSWEILEVPFEG